MKDLDINVPRGTVIFKIEMEYFLARTADPQIRAQLLQQSLDYCIEHGFINFSMRALAEEIGTSHRMLIYHFGSSEQLFEAILGEFRLRQVAGFNSALSAVTDFSEFSLAIQKLWRHLAAKENRNYMLSYLEIQIATIRKGETRKTSMYLSTTLEAWLEPISETLIRLGLSKKESRSLARAILSGGRGLILDVLGAGDTKDAKEVDEAFSQITDLISHFAQITG